MDVKDLRSEPTLVERNNDAIKFNANSSAPSYNRNKPYQDITSNQLGKVDVPTRPCAVIGPDRVIPPLVSNDLKKGPYESWPYTDNSYHYPPDYPLKPSSYQTPLRNISPRQTFQENMQRIMVPPSYNTGRINEDPNYSQEKNITLLKNVKTNIPAETKYCDVPYNINNINNDQNSARNTELRASNVNSVLTQNAPNGWPPNMRPAKPYSSHELYQYPEYASCADPRPVQINRLHRTTHEDPGLVYADPYSCDGNNRYKPYPTIKERYPQPRYEYIGNYSNPFHPAPPFPSTKYDLQKSLPPYASYPQIPLKYFDGRISEPIMDGYQRPNPQGNYNIPIRNQVIHPTYGPMLGNCIPNKMYPLPPETSVKSISANKLPYDNSKIYVDYVDNSRPKPFSTSENFYVNEISKAHHQKNQYVPNYPTVNMHPLPHPYFRKENTSFKNYEYMTQYRNMESSLPSSRFPSQISPNSIAISPSDSNTSNDAMQTHINTQEDCGYVSQSPTASIRSMDLGMNRISNDFYKRYDPKLIPKSRTAIVSKPVINAARLSKEKKGIDVRQFLQMWNEGDEENNENCKDIATQAHPNVSNKIPVPKELGKNQDQLYVLGLVNVPNEDLSKYDHIQKVSKLPENIKGYNNIELLNQFEEAIESSKTNNFNLKHSSQRDIRCQMPMKGSVPLQTSEIVTRSVSPLDVEAKISQSVIHKEVGCNFEIKPCSPQMLNVEIATPAQTILGERVIEKVTNPLILTSHHLHSIDENNKNVETIHTRVDSLPRITSNDDLKIPSCKMANTQFATNDIVPEKNNYTLQDLESNSSISLASLPRLDNDIELNFTEVNQQFINANKGETVITTAKDLTAITTNSSEIMLKNKDILQTESELSCQFSPSIESEREFAKLSKYRKIKKGSEPKSDNLQPCLQTLRTDSVIIQNPDNVKVNENNRDTISPVNKLTENLQIDPVNLSPNCRSPLSMSNINKENDKTENGVDFAIDFSISKSKSVCATSPANKDFINEIQTSPMEHMNLCTQYDTHSVVNSQSKDMNINEENPIKTNLKEYNNESDKIGKEIVNVHTSILSNEFINEHTSVKDNNTSKESTNKIQPINISISKNPKSKDTSSEVILRPDIETKLEVDESINNCNKMVLKTDTNNENRSNEKSASNKLNISNNLVLHKTVETDKQNKVTKENEKDITVADDISETKVSIECVQENHVSCDNLNNETSTVEDLSKDINTNNETSENVNISSKKYTEDILKNIDQNVSSVDNITEEMDMNNIISENIDISSNINTEVFNNYQNLSELNIVPISQTKSYPEKFASTVSLSRQTASVNCNNYSLENQSNSQIANITDITSAHIDSNSQNIQPRLSQQSLYTENDTEIIDLNNTNIKHQQNSDIKDTVLETIYVSKKSVQDVHKNLENKFTNLCNITLSPHQSEAEIKSNDLNFKDTISNIDNTNVNRIQLQMKTPDGSSSEYPVSLVPFKSYESKINLKNVNPAMSIFSLESHDNNALKEYDEKAIIKTKTIQKYQDGVYIVHTKETEKSDNSNKNNTENYSLCHSLIQSNSLSPPDVGSDINTLKNISYHISKELFSPWIQKLIMHEESACYKFYSKDSFIIKPNLDNIETTSNMRKSIDDGNKYFEIISGPKTQVNPTAKENCDTNNDKQINNRLILVSNQYCHDNTKEGDSHNRLENTITLSNTVSKQNTEMSDNCIERSNAMCDSIPNSVDNVTNVVDYCQTYPNSKDIVENINSLQEENIYEEAIDHDDKNCLNVIECSLQLQNLPQPEKTCLKRALSDSALDRFKDDSNDDLQLRWQSKRRKQHLHDLIEQPLLEDNFCSIQNIRRNSISSIYNEDNVSFCILIDNNCIITQESEQEKICITEMSENINVEDTTNNEYEITYSPSKVEIHLEDNNKCDVSECLSLENIDESLEEPWVDDVACVETVVSDDLVDDITNSAPSSPRQISSENEDTEIFNSNQHTDKVKYIYGDKMCNDDAQFVETLYRTPQMDVNKTLVNRECYVTEELNKCYDKESLEKILSDSNQEKCQTNPTSIFTTLSINFKDICDEEKVAFDSKSESERTVQPSNIQPNVLNIQTQDDTIHSCESSIDNVFNYIKKEDTTEYKTSSSPEVSSTTSEEKGSNMVLKITNFKVSRLPQYIDEEIGRNNKEINSKYTENSIHYDSGSYNLTPSRPLITKAAQKYIPPLKETFHDLKIKLPLPQHSLLKLKQLKILKTTPKIKHINANSKKEIPKKPKPKFEEVLKSIDEIQFKMLKEKSKKVKKSIPKVVIKKNENGSHYASTPKTPSAFNPDLTGRKWQPWVFLEKDNFIDKMALRKKTKAVFSYRKNAYVFAEKFQKYKSMERAKFIISSPKLEESSIGQLKCTIRLKHTY